MATAEITMGPRMGRKRIPPKGKPKTPRERFAAKLRHLLGERTAVDLADHLKCSPDSVLKWLRGETVPDLDKWPTLARALGVTVEAMVSDLE